MFNDQKTLAHQLLMKLKGQLLAENFVLNALPDESSNIDSIYKYYKPTIWSAVQLLKTELENMSPSENPWSKRNLLPFLGDALKWLTDTATMTDTWEMNQHVN